MDDQLSAERVVIRPMTQADRPGMGDSTQASFQDLQVRLGARPEPTAQPTESPNSGSALISQLLKIDAGGAWVAVLDDQICGGAMAGLREGLWYLAHLHVRPGLQGRGIGRRLLETALRYGPQARGRLLHSSLDPQAMRCYHLAGFALEPAFQATGLVRRAALPAEGRVRQGGISDFDLVADVDRTLRGAAHSPDFEVLLQAGARLLILEQGRQRGYALIDAGQPKTIAATDSATAVAVLWAALAESNVSVSVQVLRADQEWAIGVVLQAGLALEPGGPLCRQGDIGPLRPYLPHTVIL
jgi:GNAT superfamily N-acetyltransferase